MQTKPKYTKVTVRNFQPQNNEFVFIDMSAIVKYGLLSFPIASSSLGVWQLKRLEWKNALVANIESRLTEEPLDLMQIESIADLNDLEYQRVRVRGSYDQDERHQIYLKPRILVANQESLARGRTAHQNNTGVHVITPFNVSDTNLRILINRGWLALQGRDSYTDIENTKPEPGIVEVVGCIRKTDARPRYGLKNNESLQEWALRDVEALSKVLHTAPIFLDAEQNPNRTVGPIGGQTHLKIRNEHLNYAITWFSLAALTLVMWYTKYGLKRSVSTRLRR